MYDFHYCIKDILSRIHLLNYHDYDPATLLPSPSQNYYLMHKFPEMEEGMLTKIRARIIADRALAKLSLRALGGAGF